LFNGRRSSRHLLTLLFFSARICFKLIQQQLIQSWSQSNQTFFFVKWRFFPVFCYQAWPFQSKDNIFLFYKHYNLTTKIWKMKKSKFGRTDSWCHLVNFFNILRVTLLISYFLVPNPFKLKLQVQKKDACLTFIQKMLLKRWWNWHLFCQCLWPL
jgi:hypothetical protein